MSVTSANLNDLRVFVNGSQHREGRVTTSLNRAVGQANVVMAACSGSQYPSTPSLSALTQLLSSWAENRTFVGIVHDDLVAADHYDADGNACVSDTVIDASLRAVGLDQAPDLVEVDAIELYGQPPYSGFVDDPICLANGNFLLRDGDLQMFGVASALSVVRTYNSRDERGGAFGSGWSSLVDVSLAVEGRRVTYRGPDGSGSEFHQREDGSWAGGRRRGLSLGPAGDGWEVVEGHDRTWTFAADGTLVAFTALGAEVVVEREASGIRFTDRTSGRWVAYDRADGLDGLVTTASTSDGRRVEYARDGDGRLVAVRRDRGDVTYEHDDHGFMAGVVDADGVVVCRNVYDATGRVLSQVEHHGRETIYEYRPNGVSTVTASDGAPPNVMVHDRFGRMTAMIDGLGNTMRIAYDDNDNIVQVVDRTGATTRFAHDERGNVVRRTDPDGRTHQCTWDDADRLVAETDRAGNTTRYVYEGAQRDAVLVVQPDGAEVHLSFNKGGLPVSVVDADGVSGRIEWNRDGLVDAVIDGLGARVCFEYDAAGRSVSAEAPEGVRAAVEIDGAGRVLALRTAEGERTFEYSAAGRMVGGRDMAGSSWQGSLDRAGDLALLTDAEGQLLGFERDLVGRITATVNADGARATFEFDPVGRRTAVIDPEGNRTEVDYDPEGRALQVTDPSGRRVSQELDVLGRPIMAVGVGGGTSIRSYHPNGELASATDAAGNEWTYDVDVMGRVVASTDPVGNTTTYGYTPAGRLVEVRSPMGRTLRREYDAAGRLARIIEPDGTEVVFERRADGALRRVTRAGVVTSFDYDDSGRQSAIAGPWGAVATRRDAGEVTSVERGGAAAGRFEYDPRGLLGRVIDPAGVVTEFAHDRCGRLVAHTTGESTTSYRWDAAGRLASVTDAYGHSTRFDRDPRGIVDRISRPDGTGTARSFGPDGLLDAAFDVDGRQILAVQRDENRAVTTARTDISHLALQRDILGRITSVATDAGTVHYRWDADGYLAAMGDDSGHQVTIERGDGGRAHGFVGTGGHRIDVPDAVEVERDADRRIVSDEHGRRYAYDLAGRLAGTVIGENATTYGYNDLGLLATEHTPAGMRAYRYGRAGELLTQVHEDGSETSFEHDATGRRCNDARSDGGRVTYDWDAFGRLTAVTRVDAQGHETRDRIEHDPTGRPMRINDVPILWDGVVTNSVLGIGDERFVWWGNQVLTVTDPDGGWDRRVGDDPWGDEGGTGLRLGYRGELALDNLLFLGARVYDTRTRTFLSRDPLPSVPGAAAYAGVYSYAWCDPVNLVDPSGERPLSDEEYQAFRQQASQGIFRQAWTAIAEDPWAFVAKAAIMVGSIVVMAVATAALGPVGFIVAGAIVGAVSNGLNTAIDGGDWADIGRSALIGGVFGAATAGLSRFIPQSTASSLGQRVASNVLRNGATEFPVAFAQEGAESYLPGGDQSFSVEEALLNGTTGTVAGVSEAELEFRSTNITGRPDVDPPDSMPNPARDGTWTINSASASDLASVEGIGPVLSRRIIEQRDATGGFRSPDQLLDIEGIGPARLQAIIDAGLLAP